MKDGGVCLTVCILLLIFVKIISATEYWEKWPLEKLEKEMSPYLWNPTKTEEEVKQEYFEVTKAGTDKARKDIPFKLDIPYGRKPTQKYDVYGKNLSSLAPTFFWIHGGGWKGGSKDTEGYLAPSLFKKGIRNIVLGYTLAPNATIGEMIDEVLTALKNAVLRYPLSKFIVGAISEYTLSPETKTKCIVNVSGKSGHSAGAQLSAMVLHTNKGFPELFTQLSGLVLVSGLYDLRLLVPTSKNEILKMTRSEAESWSPLRIRKINPLFTLKSLEFEIFITVGEYDSPEFQRQTRKYYKLLECTFQNAEYLKSKGDDHYTFVEKMWDENSEAGKRFGEFMNKFL